MKRSVMAVVVLLLASLAGLLLGSGCSTSKARAETKAAIIDQLYTLDPNPALIAGLSANLETSGFRVDLFQGDQVTVDLYRGLSAGGYKLIIFRAHSGILGANGQTIQKTCLFTNEPYSETAHITEQFSGQLAKARINADHPWVFGVGSDFVNSVMSGKFDHTLIISMGCSTLYLNDLAQSFINRGASAFIGWDATVGLPHTDAVMPVLLEKLLSPDVTLETALNETIAEKGIDPDFHSTLKYYPQSSGRLTLSRLTR